MRYRVVIEEGPASFGAYVPDLPGCTGTGESSQEALQLALQLVQEAIEFHMEGLKEEGQHILRHTLQARSLRFKPNIC